MTAARTKLMVDQQGVTITGDNFQLTTANAGASVLAQDDIVFGAAESAALEAVVSGLDEMTRRPYGQFCSVSRALEVVGERWALLIIRDLLVDPKRVVDLQVGLPRIPADILASRLRDFERVGVVRRRVAALPGDSVRYELTEYGMELDQIILNLGRWGARLLGEQRPEEIVTTSSLTMALRATFQPEVASGVHATYEMWIGDIVLNLRVDDGTLLVAAGPMPDADVVFAPGPLFRGLLTGEVDVPAAIEDGSLPVRGNLELLELFGRMFQLPGGRTA